MSKLIYKFSLNKHKLKTKQNQFLVIFITFFYLLFFQTSVVLAQQVSTNVIEYERVYDCSKTGMCLEKNNKQNAFDLQNLAPKTPKTFVFYLSNTSSSLCQVYLNLRDIDKNKNLNEKIYIESSEAIRSITFDNLLKKQSIYLVSLKPEENKNIFFTVTLDSDTDNSFQGQRSRFKSTLYSFCLDQKGEKENKGQVKGATTETNQKVVYILSATFFTSLGVSFVSKVFIKED